MPYCVFLEPIVSFPVFRVMHDHDIGGETCASHRHHEAGELVGCHALRKEPLDGCGVGFGREVVVALRHSMEPLNGVRFGDLVGLMGKPTSQRVGVRGQW